MPASTWSISKFVEVLAVLAFVFIGLTLTTTILSSIFVAKQSTIARFSGVALPANVIGAVGEAGARVSGMVTLDRDTNQIRYEFRSSVGMTGITAVHIRGPTQLATPGLGPLATALCGSNGAPSCDTLTVPGELTGTTTNTFNAAPPTNPADLRPLINAIRAQPYLYYVEVLTNAKPVTPGSCRFDLTTTCGFA